MSDGLVVVLLTPNHRRACERHRPSGTKLYSAGMTSRIGAKGQVVIPKPFRDHLQLHPGDDVDFEVDGDAIVLTARKRPIRLGGRFTNSGMAQRLLRDRADEPR